MNFNTKLNIGDSVWHISIREGCIRETTITGITIVHKPFHPHIQTSIVYESKDNCNFAEENEGKTWWSTRKGIIDYLTRKLVPVGNGKKSNPIARPRNLNDEFEDFFRDELPKPPQEHFKIVPPPMRSTNKELRKIFEDVFGTPPPPVAKPKHVRCDCGLHRISELKAERAKRTGRWGTPPGIREKTISDLYDELFEE